MKLAILLSTLLAAAPALAQLTIDQNKALAGGITAGDTAGFPVLLSQPGHYKLNGNLAVPDGVVGILITAENVTMDLNGYTVRGPVTCTRNTSTRYVDCGPVNSLSVGIYSAQKDTVVRNGMVRGFSGTGVSLVQTGAAEGLRLSHNAGYGLFINEGDAHHVHAEMNGSGGLWTANGMVGRSTARSNGNNGIRATLVQDSLASANQSCGVSHSRVRGTLAHKDRKSVV